MSGRVVLGIDPGLSGGIGWTDGETAGCAPMPILAGHPDLSAIEELLSEHRPALVVIERAECRPGSGAPSGLTIGVNFGMLVGLIHGSGRPYQIVPAKVWKVGMGLPSSSVKGPKDEDEKAKKARQTRATKERKEAAILMAERLFPSVDLVAPGCKVKHDGLAESLLIAEYGRRLLNGARLKEEENRES